MKTRLLYRNLIVFALVVASIGFAQSNLKYSITVTKFENKANWSGRWDLGDAWGTIMTDTLTNSGKFIVLGEKDMRQEAMLEQDFAASGRTAQGKKAPAIGQMTPAQLLVKGAITHVQETKGGGGGIGFKGITLGGGGGVTEINVTIYIVDSRTGQVKASKSVIGSSGKKGLKIGYHGSALGGLTGDLGGFDKDNMGKATVDAINQCTEFLISQLDSIPWEATIISANNGKFIINRGTREGIAAGMMFQVGKSEELTDPDTGEVLDRTLEKVGAIKVDTVREKVAICSAIDGADKIQKGMSAMPQ